jgi:L-rhamnose mutarotase
MEQLNDLGTRRLCFALDLNDDADLIAQYEAHHAAGAVWPGIVDLIRAQGVLSMEIWRTSDRCFMIAEVASDYPRPLSDAAMALDAEWQALMWRFQKPLPNAAPGEKWRPMAQIFSLADQARQKTD